MWKQQQIQQGSFCFWIVTVEQDPRTDDLVLTLKIIEGDHSIVGKPIAVRFETHGPGIEHLRLMLEVVLGKKIERRVYKFDLDKLLGKEFAATFYQGTVTEFFTVGEYHDRFLYAMRRMDRISSQFVTNASLYLM